MYLEEKYVEVKSEDYFERAKKKMDGSVNIATWFDKNFGHKKDVVDFYWSYRYAKL